jgi:predicted kinase
MTTGNFATARRPALILLSGLPGAGKTTFARELAKAIPFTHFESDAVRRGIAPAPTYASDESAKVFRTIETRAEKALRSGVNALVDATNLTKSDRRRFHRLASRVDALFVAVRITAPDAVIRERLARPRDGHSQADLAVYEMMRGRAQPFAVPVVVVDTRFDLEPSIALVVRLVETGTS